MTTLFPPSSKLLRVRNLLSLAAALPQVLLITSTLYHRKSGK